METRAFRPYPHSLDFNYRQTSLGFYSGAIFQIYCISDTFKNSTSVWELQERPVSRGGLTAPSLGLFAYGAVLPPSPAFYCLILPDYLLSSCLFLCRLLYLVTLTFLSPIRRASRSSPRRPRKKIWMSWFSPCWSTAARRRWTRGSVSILLFFFFCSLHHTYLSYSVFIEGEENLNQTFESVFMTDLERFKLGCEADWTPKHQKWEASISFCKSSLNCRSSVFFCKVQIMFFLRITRKEIILSLST